jgi:hypothetical protein
VAPITPTPCRAIAEAVHRSARSTSLVSARHSSPERDSTNGFPWLPTPVGPRSRHRVGSHDQFTACCPMQTKASVQGLRSHGGWRSSSRGDERERERESRPGRRPRRGNCGMWRPAFRQNRLTIDALRFEGTFGQPSRPGETLPLRREDRLSSHPRTKLQAGTIREHGPKHGTTPR